MELVSHLSTLNFVLQSLNGPIDTTYAQGRLIFNVFASLAEFERELSQERTLAGLSATRAKDRTARRPKGLPANAEATAIAIETLHREGKLSIAEICKWLSISKSTIYSYLRHRVATISVYHKKYK